MTAHPSRSMPRHVALTRLALAVGLAFAVQGPACAARLTSAESDLVVNWDNTLKYSTAYRLKDPSPVLTADVSADDGDRNFKKGIISNRVDLLSEFDVAYRDYGLRLSGAAWYDTVYNRSNDNDSPGTVNHTSAPYNEFTAATRSMHGRRAEMLDAFVFGKFEIGDSQAAFRLGKHTLQYGESLFYGANGIAAAQAPIDVIKALSVPNIKFNELIMPVWQASGFVQITPDVAVGAYYQLRWEPNRLPCVGSYFAFSDSFSCGGENLVLPGIFVRGQDQRAKDSGQGGVQLRFSAAETDFGLYAVRWHSKNGSLLTDVVNNTYLYAYHEGIRAVGASASHTYGPVNLAAEVSLRNNMPLSSTQAAPFASFGNNSDNPLYAVGKTAHAQVSGMASFGRALWWNESSLLAEVAWNRLLSISKNPAAIDPGHSRDAASMRMVFEPTMRQVVSGLDLGTPVGLGMDVMGRSAITGWAVGTGSFNLGLNAVYLDTWRASLTYNRFLGAAAPLLGSTPGYAGPTLNNKQFWKDRDYISLSLRRTF